MSNIEIRIQSLKEFKETGHGNFPDIGKRAKKIYDLPAEKVSIMEAGTAMGRVSIGLISEAIDGTAIVLNLTNSQLQSIAAAAQGAQDRFDGK